LNVPHPPFSYDRSTGRFDLHNSPLSGYWDNLALADVALGELRRAMQAAGLWDKSSILLSADHWYRSSATLDGKTDRRVPFMLKLARASDRISYDGPFNTVLTHDLVLALLHSERFSPQTVCDWLNRNRGRWSTIVRAPSSGVE
jgi:hypothetical protein